MMKAQPEDVLVQHAKNLKTASREQIDLARIFQCADFADDDPCTNDVKREIEEQPDTFIPGPIYLDMAIMFSGSPWKERLLDALK